jgi:hypothetical protein
MGWDDEPRFVKWEVWSRILLSEKKDDGYSASDSLSSNKEHVDDVAVRPKAFNLHHRVLLTNAKKGVTAQ